MYENEMIDCRVCRGILPVNCLPFLGQKKKVQGMGGFVLAKMHGRETRLRALRLFERGLGRDAVARELGLSRSIVGKWLLTCRAVGSGVFLEMGGAHGRTISERRWRPRAPSWIGAGRSPRSCGTSASRRARRSTAGAARTARAARRRCAPGPRAGGRPRAEDSRGGARARGAQARGPGDAPKKSIALKAELGLLPGRGPRP